MTGITIYQHRNTAILSLKERVDAVSASELRKVCDSLFACGTTHFIIDLSQTPVIDSSGIAVLVNIFKRCRQLNGTMKLSQALSPAAHRILKLTRFDLIFETIEQREIDCLLTPAR